VQIAEIIGVAPPSIRNFLKKHNLELNLVETTTRYKLNDERKQEILKLHHEGLNVADISKKVDLSTTAIRKFLISENLTPNIYENKEVQVNCHICDKTFTPKHHKKDSI